MKGKTLFRKQYTLNEEIAYGGFATIYRAKEKNRPDDVAIKIGRVDDDPAYAKSIREEARIIRGFNHRNIVKIRPIPRPGKADTYVARAIELAGSPYFFVMEYLEGGTLDQYLEQVRSITPPEATAVALEIARALRHMHLLRYAHNDLKLENIVFRQPVTAGQPFRPVLIDFGIATRIQRPGAASLYITPPEGVDEIKMATPPELSADLDRTKFDVWGLGVALYSMLGGRLPFSARTERTLTQRIRNSRPTSLQDLSKDVSSSLDELVIDGCLAKNPQHRLSILELGKQLKKIGDGATAVNGVEPGKKGWWPFSRK